MSRRILDESPLVRKISQQSLQNAFDTQPVITGLTEDLLSLRDAMTRLITSEGGRPGIAGADERAKIPRIEQDWILLEKITEAGAHLKHKPSVGQTAAVVLHLALQKFAVSEIEDEIKKIFDAAPAGS